MADTDTRARTQQTADEDIASLRSQMESKNAELEASRRAEKEAREAAEKAVAERVRSDEVAITSALSAAEESLKSAKRAYAEAMEKGDFAAAADSQDNIADARGRVNHHTGQKTRLEQWKAQETARLQQQSDQTGTGDDDPLAPYSPQTRAWLTRTGVHLDQKRMQQAIGYHNLAVADGITPDTDAYFRYIEEKMGIGDTGAQPGANGSARSSAAKIEDPPEPGTVTVDLSKPQEEQVETNAPKIETDKDESAMAAPPARQPPPSQGQAGRRPGTVRLSASEMEAAKFSFPHLKPEEAYREYAINKASLIEEGRLS